MHVCISLVHICFCCQVSVAVFSHNACNNKSTQVDMKGLIPPVILSRFLQRQPLAIHYLRQCVVEEARKHTPAVHIRFSLRSNGVPSDHRTKEQCDGDSDEETQSVNSLEFANNALASIVCVNNASYKQYEEPVGISEFIGYNTAPRTKRRQRRRHRCCQSSQEQGGGANKESFFSSGSCEECHIHRGISVGADNTAGSGSRRRYNYITQ